MWGAGQGKAGQGQGGCLCRAAAWAVPGRSASWTQSLQPPGYTGTQQGSKCNYKASQLGGSKDSKVSPGPPPGKASPATVSRPVATAPCPYPDTHHSRQLPHHRVFAPTPSLFISLIFKMSCWLLLSNTSLKETECFFFSGGLQYKFEK